NRLRAIRLLSRCVLMRLCQTSQKWASEFKDKDPRYIDSSDTEESWDIYASMFGGAPDNMNYVR
ncbi:hypothetical protein, partial [Vibrio lentus]